jgi:hypothetical protein
MEELLEFVSDMDNIVKIKAFEAIARLVHSDSEERESMIEEAQIAEEIMPAFLKLTETVLEDEDGLQLMSSIFGMFIYAIHRKFPSHIKSNENKLAAFFQLCYKSKDEKTRENAAYNFPCVFSLFCKNKLIDFPDVLLNFSKIECEK